MAKYRFSWDAFDDKTVEALADVWGYNDRTRAMDRRTWLSEVKKRPDDDFVFATKDTLIDTWLARLPANQSPDAREPHAYQRDAWQHMTTELGKFDSNHKFQGMLVMPTGSGKTFTTTRWLMENHVNRGKRVLWIAHRHELLEQAGAAFLQSGAVATKQKLLRMRLVSGRHCSAHQIDPDDDIVLASVYSLARHPDVADELLSDPNLFLIVDEAHHSVAKTYRDLIERLTGRSRDRVAPRPFRLLGFAINVLHAKLLTDELKAVGVSADYVASYRPDREAIDNQEVIRRFRDPDEELEVLVNVQILTEGVDVPEIQTVFLMRPTSSDILLRQMIGRALRGPKAGGTEVAYIVSFEDHWEKFRDWESPLDLVADITAPEEPLVAQPQGEAAKTELAAALPWDLIQSTARELRNRIRSTPVERFGAVPDGWYVLERENEGLEVRQIIHVHAHQKPSWAAFISWLSSPDKDALGVVSAEDAFEEFFGDCDDPAPSSRRLCRNDSLPLMARVPAHPSAWRAHKAVPRTRAEMAERPRRRSRAGWPD